MAVYQGDEYEQLASVVMPFGKHKGMKLDKVPLSYLDWLVGQDLREPFKSKLEAYMRHPTVVAELEREVG